MDEREVANRAAREHLEQMRARLAAGREEVERQNASVSDTRRHIEEIRRWQEESSRLRDDEPAA